MAKPLSDDKLRGFLFQVIIGWGRACVGAGAVLCLYRIRHASAPYHLRIFSVQRYLCTGKIRSRYGSGIWQIRFGY